MNTLGVVIILILLLIILPILVTIRKKQKNAIEYLDNIADALNTLNDNIGTMRDLIATSFNDVIAKSVVIDSKQMSIKDMLKDITQGLELYTSKAIHAINVYGKARPKNVNKGSRQHKITKQVLPLKNDIKP